MARLLHIVGILLLLAAGGMLFLAMGGYAASQIGGSSPAGSNPFGYPGALAAHYFIRFWGLGAFLVPVLMVGYGVALWRGFDLSNLGRRLSGAILLMFCLPGLLHLLPVVGVGHALLVAWDQTNLEGLGGALGWWMCSPARTPANPQHAGGWLSGLLEPGGAAVVLIALALLAIGMMQIGLGRWLRRLWSAVREWRSGDDSRVRPAIDVEPFVPAPRAPADKRRHTTSIDKVAARMSSDEGMPADARELIERIRQHRKALESGGPAAAPAAATTTGNAAPPTTEPPAEPPATAAETPPAPVEPAAAEPAAAAGEPPTAKPARRPARPKAAGRYALPPVDLLGAAPARREAEHDAEKQSIGKAIEEVFANFDIQVQVVAATRGPVVTQYEIRLLDQAMRVGKVEGFEKDLALKLGTEGIRIVAPLPNKTTVGIEVPNRVKAMVVMRDLVDEVDPSTMALPVVLGRDVVGRPMVADLAKMPHLLVAGATGMGKSVCMNAMICSVLLFRSPDEVKFIMVDPKMVELAGYEDIPHLLAPPITDMTKAHAALEWACRTMDARYEILKTVGVRDISAYNQLGEDDLRFRLAKKEMKLEDLEGAQVRLPYIVVLVDEYADLMMVNKEVEKSIVRLAAKSRACGIHVILTTQRPSADVVTGLIKSNLPSRICFRVVDRSNSRVVLDVAGAENLLGKGDMLFLQPGTSFPIRGQGVWLKDQEIEAIVAHAKEQGRPEYDEEVLKVGAVAVEGGGSSGAAAGDAWKTDRTFHEAVACMYRHGKTGADFFRRRLNIGYNKATQYVEQLEDLGFVGPQKGTLPREITKTFDDWLDLLKANGVAIDPADSLYHDPIRGEPPGG